MKNIILSKRNMTFAFVFFIIFFGIIRESMIRYVITIRPMYTLLPALLIVLLSITRLNHRTFIWEYVFFALGIVTYVASGTDTIITLSSIMIACKQYDYKSLIKTTFFSILFSMFIVCSLSYVGVLREIHFYRIGTNDVRSAFGFIHPNLFSLFLCALNFSLVAYKEEKYSFKYLITMLVSLYIVYKYPKSYTVAIVMLLFVILYVLLRMGVLLVFFRDVKWVFKLLIVLGVPLLVIMVYRISALNSSLDFLLELGTTANSRLKIAHEALVRYGISLFGQHVETYGTIYFIMRPYATESYFNIDCLYIKMLVQHGLVASMIFWGSLIKSLKEYMEMNNYLLACIGFVLVIYSIMETGLSNPALFFIVVGWGGMSTCVQNRYVNVNNLIHRIKILQFRRGNGR